MLTPTVRLGDSWEGLNSEESPQLRVRQKYQVGYSLSAKRRRH